MNNRQYQENNQYSASLGIDLIICLATLCLSSVLAVAEPAAFLAHGLNARSMAMGSAMVAVADDSSAIYTNPAGMSLHDDVIFSATQYQAFETNTIAGEAIVPIGFTRLGLGYIGSSITGINESVYNNSLERYQDTGASFDYTGTSITVAGSSALPIKGLSVGASAKLISEKLYSNQGMGVGADLGILYDTRIHDIPIRLGARARNIIPTTIKWDTESQVEETLPLTIAAGISAKFLGESLLVAVEGQKALPQDDTDSSSNTETTYHAGAEYWLNDYAALRAGYNNGNITAGFGLKLNQLSLDYAMLLPTESQKELMDTTSKISLALTF